VVTHHQPWALLTWQALPVELVLACMISSIDTANRLLHHAISSYCYVSRLTVSDYVPNPNAIDELMDRVTPAIQRIGDKMVDGIKGIVDRPNGARRSSRGRSSSAQ
jgi:hypothetical protein